MENACRRTFALSIRGRRLPYGVRAPALPPAPRSCEGAAIVHLLRRAGTVGLALVVLALATTHCGATHDAWDAGGRPSDTSAGPDEVDLFDAGPLPDAPRPAGAQVVINEVMARAADNGVDWVELHNIGSARAELWRWRLCDEHSCLELPPATALDSGAYLVLKQEPEGPGVQVL